MKNLNILLILLFMLTVSCTDKKTKEEEEVLPTSFTIDNYYSSTGEGYTQLNNGIVYFRKTSDPLITFAIQISNTETRTGTFPITYGSFDYKLGSTQENHIGDSGDIGTITITKNTSSYMQGTYIFKASTKTFIGTFSGHKN